MSLFKKLNLQIFQSDKLQEQQDLIAELQCHLSTPGLLGLGLNLSSRPHTAPMGSMQHGPNGGIYRQVSSQLVCCNIIILSFIFFTCLIHLLNVICVSEKLQYAISRKNLCQGLFMCRYVTFCVFACVWLLGQHSWLPWKWGKW